MANYPALCFLGPPKGHHERGFTLIESMCATLVLVVGMMAVMSAETGAARVHGNSKQLFRATQLASNMLQVCGVLDPQELSILAQSSFAQSFDAAGTLTKRGRPETLFQLSLTPGAASSSVNNVVVTVSWNAGTKQTPKQIQLTGMFPK